MNGYDVERAARIGDFADIAEGHTAAKLLYATALTAARAGQPVRADVIVEATVDGLVDELYGPGATQTSLWFAATTIAVTEMFWDLIDQVGTLGRRPAPTAV